jgi:hypothetical protein
LVGIGGKMRQWFKIAAVLGRNYSWDCNIPIPNSEWVNGGAVGLY